MNLNSIPAFDDNYIWVLNDEAGRCLIVDPGDAEPVLNAIAANNWQPEAIFLTHHHHDHVGGVKELVEKFPQIVVYGPQAVSYTHLDVYKRQDKSGRNNQVVKQYMAKRWSEKFHGQRDIQAQLMSHLDYALAHTDWHAERQAGDGDAISRWTPYDKPVV